MAPRPKQKLLAECRENQAALDRLAAKRAAMGPNDRLTFTLKKAMISLAAATEPVLTHQQAVALKHIGSHCATIICPPDKERLAKKTKQRPQLNNNDPSTAASSAASSPADSVRSNGSMTAPTRVKRPRKVAGAAAAALTATQLATILEGPTSKEMAYQNAVAAAEQWQRLGPLTWRVVLIIDNREVRSEHIQAKCQMSGIPCEERQLPIGDMAWLAQGLRPSNNNSNDTVVVVELLLGTIIERKTPEDLKASLFGTRYWEQRLRLQYSGLPQVLFLIEGDLSKELFHCSSDTLQTAVWETRLNLQFSIVHTAHMDETVLTLKRMHRRILQRSFPRAFTATTEALPNFTFEREAAGERRQEGQQGRRRRRQRRQSLENISFDMNPILPLGMDRFISYPELKAKIERDREAGTKTVGNLHLAMLKQVTTWNAKKCQALANVYPTFNQLMEAYHENDSATTNKLVTDLTTYEPGKSAIHRTIGVRSTEELNIAYQMRDENEPETPATASTTIVVAPSVPRSHAVVRADPVVDENDCKPAAVETKRRIDLSMDDSSSSGDDAAANYKQKPLFSKKRKKALNTSIGSLLNSSDDDDDETIFQTTIAAVMSTAMMPPGMKLFAWKASKGKSLSQTSAASVPSIYTLDSSSDDEDEEEVGTLRERIMQARKFESKTNSSIRGPMLNDVIEID